MCRNTICLILTETMCSVITSCTCRLESHANNRVETRGGLEPSVTSSIARVRYHMVDLVSCAENVNAYFSRCGIAIRQGCGFSKFTCNSNDPFASVRNSLGILRYPHFNDQHDYHLGSVNLQT